MLLDLIVQVLGSEREVEEMGIRVLFVCGTLEAGVEIPSDSFECVHNREPFSHFLKVGVRECYEQERRK